MNQRQIREYRAATAERLRDEVEGRTVRDAEAIRSFDRATAAGLRTLREIDHANALLDLMASNADAPEHVRAVAHIMALNPALRDVAVTTDRKSALVEDRRRTAGRLLDGPCPCGSGQTARDCTAPTTDGV